MPRVAITIATSQDVPDLVRFFRAVAAAEAADDPAAAEQGEAGLRRSLEAWDFLRSDTCFLLLARLDVAPSKLTRMARADTASGDQLASSGWAADSAPAGYLLAVRIPKADPRVGFLFVDEVYVRPDYRRQGVARALLERVQALAGELGLAGVRLLVREGNETARALYRSSGFAEHETIFCQWQDDKMTS